MGEGVRSETEFTIVDKFIDGLEQSFLSSLLDVLSTNYTTQTWAGFTDDQKKTFLKELIAIYLEVGTLDELREAEDESLDALLDPALVTMGMRHSGR